MYTNVFIRLKENLLLNMLLETISRNILSTSYFLLYLCCMLMETNTNKSKCSAVRPKHITANCLKIHGNFHNVLLQIAYTTTLNWMEQYIEKVIIN